MDLVAEAKLPISFDNFQEALKEFLQLVRARCVPNGQSSIHLDLHENGCKANRVLAEALPPGVKTFTVGPGLDLRKMVSPAEFLAQVHLSPPARSYCHATLTDSLSFEQGLALVEKIAEALPPSGRSITIMLLPERVKLRGAPDAVRADLMFARWQAGPQRKAASLRVACPAESTSDARARQALRTVGELLGLRFGKPWKQYPLGSDKEKPYANTVWVAHKSFQAAFDLTTKDGEEEGITLDRVPLLFPRFQAFGKRIADVQQGKREQIDLVSHLKRLVRESQRGYVFDQSDAEWVMFRKHLTPALDGLLSFERFHHHGLGKSFTLQVGVDFPGNRELQQNPLSPLFRERFFTLFHRNWEEPAWTYATAEELIQALQGCAALLSRVLPLLECRLVEMLSPLPTELPMTIPSLGTLSARQAYERALPVARSWANDVELLSVGSLPNVDLRDLMGPAIDYDGRLRSHARWTARFLSPYRAAHLFVTLPHTGAIRWATVPLLPTQRSFPSISSPDWLDSTAIASTVNTRLREHVEVGYRVEECLYNLGSRHPNSAETVWEVHAILHGKERYDRRDVQLIFDPWNGSPLSIE